MKYIFGNWKMHLTPQSAKALAGNLINLPDNTTVTTAVFPPFTLLHPIQGVIQHSSLKLGAQDCSPHAKGAFTGDISASMLSDAGCKYVLTGHSERRSVHKEDSQQVQAKAMAVIEQGLIPVICVGEDLTQRESGNYIEIITDQVKKSLPYLTHSNNYIIAYEPVWAIGTGKIPTLNEIEEVHKTIASLLYHDTSLAHNASVKTAILYGGSVKASNAKEILSTQYVDGVLVGGASLDAEEFKAIIKCA